MYTPITAIRNRIPTPARCHIVRMNMSMGLRLVQLAPARRLIPQQQPRTYVWVFPFDVPVDRY